MRNYEMDIIDSKTIVNNKNVKLKKKKKTMHIILIPKSHKLIHN